MHWCDWARMDWRISGTKTSPFLPSISEHYIKVDNKIWNYVLKALRLNSILWNWRTLDVVMWLLVRSTSYAMSACAASPDLLTVTVWTFKANGHPGESQVLLQNPGHRWALSSNVHGLPIFSTTPCAKKRHIKNPRKTIRENNSQLKQCINRDNIAVFILYSHLTFNRLLVQPQEGYVVFFKQSKWPKPYSAINQNDLQGCHEYLSVGHLMVKWDITPVRNVLIKLIWHMSKLMPIHTPADLELMNVNVTVLPSLLWANDICLSSCCFMMSDVRWR